jgi:transcriptional regulator with XRE-family HTH domain
MTRGRKAAPAQGPGKRWRQLREDRAWSLEEAAEATGISPQALSAIETWKREPGSRTLRMAAAVYGVPVEELIDEDAFPIPKALLELDRAGAFDPPLTLDEKRRLARGRLLLGREPDKADFPILVAWMRRGQ